MNLSVEISEIFNNTYNLHLWWLKQFFITHSIEFNAPCTMYTYISGVQSAFFVAVFDNCATRLYRLGSTQTIYVFFFNFPIGFTSFTTTIESPCFSQLGLPSFCSKFCANEFWIVWNAYLTSATNESTWNEHHFVIKKEIEHIRRTRMI